MRSLASFPSAILSVSHHHNTAPLFFFSFHRLCVSFDFLVRSYLLSVAFTKEKARKCRKKRPLCFSLSFPFFLNILSLVSVLQSIKEKNRKNKKKRSLISPSLPYPPSSPFHFLWFVFLLILRVFSFVVVDISSLFSVLQLINEKNRKHKKKRNKFLHLLLLLLVRVLVLLLLLLLLLLLRSRKLNCVFELPSAAERKKQLLRVFVKFSSRACPQPNHWLQCSPLVDLLHCDANSHVTGLTLASSSFPLPV